jgi:hypothetical protein
MLPYASIKAFEDGLIETDVSRKFIYIPKIIITIALIVE